MTVFLWKGRTGKENITRCAFSLVFPINEICSTVLAEVSRAEYNQILKPRMCRSPRVYFSESLTIEVAVCWRYRDACFTVLSNFVINLDSLLDMHEIISKVTTRSAIYLWTATFMLISFSCHTAIRMIIYELSMLLRQYAVRTNLQHERVWEWITVFLICNDI